MANIENNKEGIGSKQEQTESAIESDGVNVPVQYEGLSADIVEEIWTIPLYVDPEKTKLENERKEKVLAFLREQENQDQEIEEGEIVGAEDLQDVRDRLNSDPGVKEGQSEKDSYEHFKMANGENSSVEGLWWNSFRNRAAKELKESGQFEWGKERIYFDVPLDNFKKLAKIIERVAGREKIAVAFKYLDLDQTYKSHIDGEETRFVTNFASGDDALSFYLALRQDPEYQSIQPDRDISYGGYRADDLAEYANGFRETRDTLGPVMEGKFNDEGKWEYMRLNGLPMSIPAEAYENMKKQYESLNLQLEAATEKWRAAIEGGTN